MLTKFNLILIFKYFKILFANLIGVFFLFFSCEDANYQLDNPFDPENMDLDPPALFFHPYEITTSLDNSFSVEVYGLELEPAAGAHIDVRYDWGSVHIDSVVPGPFFTGDNNPMEITVDDIQGILDIFIYYLPDIESDQSQGGTWSLATIYFTAYTTGGSELLFGENTKLRDKDNLDVFINEFGSGYINVE